MFLFWNEKISTKIAFPTDVPIRLFLSEKASIHPSPI